MNVIDSIITSQTEFTPFDFTGGNIQYSVSKYNKKLSVKLVLFFGFSVSRNSISRSFEIEPDDAKKFSIDLYRRAITYLEELKKKETKKLSYECLTKDVRGTSNGSGNGDSGRVGNVDSGTKKSAKASDKFDEHTKANIRDAVIEVFNEARRYSNIPLPIALKKMNHAHYDTLYLRYKDAKKLVDVKEQEFPQLLQEIMEYKFKQKRFIENDSISFNTFTYASNFNKYLEEMVGSL